LNGYPCKLCPAVDVEEGSGSSTSRSSSWSYLSRRSKNHSAARWWSTPTPTPGTIPWQDVDRDVAPDLAPISWVW